ncbi:MAG TPA: hypothetical protein ENJ75_00040 [Candidatus Kaiserbacteria bacterium]|nr:hypothetical protein [Candidatus Kaiserbacteria bacterium]
MQIEPIPKKRIADYIESCHTSDGGYFFANVEPSSGLDTYLAVKTLRILNTKTKNTASIAGFWKKETLDGHLHDLFSIYLAVETYKELDLPTDDFNIYRKSVQKEGEKTFSLVPSFRKHGLIRNNRASLRHAMNSIRARGRSLQRLLYFTTLARDLDFEMHTEKVSDFIYSIQNSDGGFGAKNESNILTTFHALHILKSLSLPIKHKNKIIHSLTNWFNESVYIENLFYSTEGLALLDTPAPDIEKTVRFVYSCQKNNGGFSRDRMLGIPKIENTYMAVRILKHCETFTKNTFLT